jgi:parallel beta helix pectate lyase-like protein
MFYLNGYFGEAPGWSGPSWQADLYYPWHIVPGRSVVFGALQAATDDYGKGYFNAGVGYREYFPEQDRILGAWGWLDWDDTNNTGWLRFSGSLESLGKYLDVRANWYVLADQGGSTVTSGFTGSPFFQGYNIDLNRRTVTEDAFDGLDLEFGGRLPFLGRYGVSGYVGPYYLHSDSNGGTWGVEGRINVAVTDNCQVNVTMQHDSVFDTTTFVNVSLALPDGMPTKWFKPQDVIDRLSSMVIRRDRIPVLDEVSNESVPFLNVPGTTAGNPTNTKGDLPVFVVHVDPNLPADSGNGTAENPFGSLEQARQFNKAAVDIIDIEPRTDGTGTNLTLNGSFNLFNYQRVWSTSVSHAIDTTAGIIDIPATTATQGLPLVSNSAITANGTVFSMASVDEISGLHISGANSTGTVFGNGISNLGGPIVDFNINQNQFTNYQNAVFLQNAFGDGSSLHLNSNQLVNNTATGTTGTSQNGFEIINTNPGTMTVNVSGNSSSNNMGDGYLLETANGGAVINAVFTNNSASNNGTTGMHIEAAGGTFNVESFTGNSVTNNPGNGVWLDANNTAGGGTINVTNFQANTITGNGTAAVGPIGSDPDGLLISAQGGTAVVNAAIGVMGGQANNIANNGSPGIGGAGIHVFVNNGGTVNGSIVNNLISSNVSFGINIDALDGTIGKIGSSPSMAGAVPFLIESNTISGNGDAGIWVRLQNDSTAGVQILSNSIVNQINGPSPLAGGEGIHFRTEGTSFLWDADIENNFIGIASNGSAGPNLNNGIEFETFGNSELANTVLYPGLSLVKIINNIIEFNGGDGINFQRNGDSLVNDVLITNNTIKFNMGNGMNLIMNGGANDISNGGAPLTINFDIQQNTVNNNGINGIAVEATANAMFRPIITDNIIENNGQDGINASTLYFAQLQGTWSNNTIESNGRDGIRFTDGDESGPSFNVTLANNIIENNLADGIFYTSVETIPLGGGNGTVDITDNLIKKNGGNGVDVQVTGSAVANINLTDNQIIFNTLDGVNMVANKFAAITTTSSGNTITNNGADGWQFTTQTGSDSNIFLGNGLIDATLTDNIISFNGARGIDILNQWNGQMNIDIEGTVNPTLPANIGNPANDSNIVDANGQQGIFVENAADLSLSQQSPLNYFQVSTTAPTTVAPIIQLTVNQTEISGNGTNAALVNATPDAGDGILINVGTSQFGYVNAAITNNHFSGNANISFVTQSFVSTAQPSVTNFYNPANFTINPAFQPDPLARLALVLTGNVGNNVDVTRTGAFYGGTTQAADLNKTIPGTWDGVTNDGNPTTFTFVTADDVRRRNAQREPGVTNVDGSAIDGGALIIGGYWLTQAELASSTSPNFVSATPTPSTTNWGPTISMIANNGDFVNAFATIEGTNRVITTTAAAAGTTPQSFTITQALGAAPIVGSSFTVTAAELAGTGESTFVTTTASATTLGTQFSSVLTGFNTQVGFLNGLESPGEGQFPFGWRTVSTLGPNFPSP